MDESTPVYVFGEFTLDLNRACLLRNGERLNLRPKVLDTLRYLVEHRGRVATKEDLVRALWPSVIVTDDSLIKCIQELRTALDDQQHHYIRTIPRRGYLFEAVVATSTPGGSESTRGETIGAARPAAPPLALHPGRSRRRGRVARSASIGAVVLLATAAYWLTAPGWLASERRPEPGTKSVAVLPFVSIGGESEDYFADGVSEELINALANVPGLHVPSRTSSFTFKGTNTDLRTIGDALNVDHVLEGSVRKAGSRVRITAQLIDVETDLHLWSATYDREIADVFAIQDEIASSVAEAMRIELFGASRPAARAPSVAAYDAYLLGTHYARKRRLEDNALVRQSFARAIELDPDYAAPYAGLAIALLTGQSNGILDRAALAEADRAATRALELDPAFALAYVARGSLARSDGNYASADADLSHAIDLQPGLAEAHFQRMSVLGALGRFDEARAALDRALELDPLNGFYNRWMGNVQLALGNFDQAAVYDRRAVQFEPSQANAYAGLGDIALMTGHVDDGLVSYLKGVRLDPAHAHMTALIGQLYVSLGDAARARLWFDKAAALYQVPSVASLFRDFIPVTGAPADPDTLIALVRDVPASQFVALGSRLFRKALLQTGDVPAIEAFHRQHWPELFEREPLVNGNNFGAAPDVAWLYVQRGEPEHANRLLDLALAVIRDSNERSINPPEWSVCMTEVETLALKGRTSEALAALRRAIDAGWRMEWWQVGIDPTLATIRHDPAFLAMMAEVRADVSRQLERVRALERSGEIDGRPVSP